MNMYIVKTMYIKSLPFATSRIIICTARSLSCCTLPNTFHLRREESERRGRCYGLRTSNFHTSQKLHLPPVVTLAVCTFLQFGSVASGYYLRQWWLRRTPDQQAEYRKRYWERRRIFLGSVGLFSSILLIYYAMHMERDPVVQRPRFVIFNKEDQAAVGNMILTMLLVKYKEDIIPISDPMYSKLTKILRKLANANRDVFKKTQWTISVVNAPSLTNAMVLPSGNVFVFSGIFNVVDNDDQLTFVLAHEISHVLLLHTMEILSYTVLKELAYVLPTFLIWACFSRWKALSVYLGAGLLHKVLIQFPYQRQLELEADEVGLQLAAKSCIDVREVLLFWEMMKKYSDLMEESQYEVPILMTHPTHMYRNMRLADQMPRALDLREKAGCPKLPKLDLQKELERYTKDLEERFQKQEMFVTVSP